MRGSWFKAGFRLCTVLLLVTVAPLGAAASGIPEVKDSGPALWKLDGGANGGEVYLFGSIHMLKKDLPWFTPRIEMAFARANELIFETSIDSAATAEVQKLVLNDGIYPKKDSLQRHIDPALFDAVAEEGRQIGIPSYTLDRLKPWYAATVLSLGFIQSQGYNAKLGVETYLAGIAAKRGIKLSGLETIDQQMRSLTGNPPAVQVAMLSDTVKELKNDQKTLDVLTEAWIKGDTAVLDRQLIEPMRAIPGAYDALVLDRNKRWLPEIVAMLKEPGVHFVVVGTAHLIGKDGLVSMLRAGGFKVERQ